MDVYLMQHGVNLDKEVDPEEPLSPEGEQQIRQSARAMEKMGIRPALLVASTKKRALQTARIVGETLGCDSEAIVETEMVKAKAEPDETLDFLGRYADRDSIFVAGHLPSPQKLASRLLSGGERVNVNFHNGGLCAFSADTLPTEDAELEYCLTPEQLQQIAGGT